MEEGHEGEKGQQGGRTKINSTRGTETQHGQIKFAPL